MRTVLTPRLRDCRLFVLDMDGTLYLGDTVLPGAVEFVRRLADTGRRYVYLTNNSSRSEEDYVNRLQKLGFPCGRADVFTSGEAAALYLNENHPGAAVYAVGTAALSDELRRNGVKLCQDAPDVVLAGFDTELTYEKLRRATSFLRHGAAFLAANPDWVCPMDGDEVLPDCGSICALLTAATGKTPVFIGKPEPRMIELAAGRLKIPMAQVCCVGDRLYTDVAAAQNAGAVSALVLSGETTRKMLEAWPRKPDFVFDSVADIP